MTEDKHNLQQIKKIYNSRSEITLCNMNYAKTILADITFLEQHVKGKNRKILDVGFGSGQHLINLHLSGHKNLIGLEISEAAFNRAKVNFEKKNINVTLSNVDFIGCDLFQDVDCITSFLSCFGQFGAEGDISFLKRSFSALNRSGKLIMTLFLAEGVHLILGDFTAQYSMEDEKVESNVAYDFIDETLQIKQRIYRRGNSLELPTESIKIYTSDRLKSLLRQVGFKKIKISSHMLVYGGYFTLIAEK